MRRNVAIGGSLLATVLLGVAFGEGIKSGLQVGESATPFNVRNITGQNCAVDYAQDDRGSLCYR
jgi:hypothetical protein